MWTSSFLKIYFGRMLARDGMWANVIKQPAFQFDEHQRQAPSGNVNLYSTTLSTIIKQSLAKK